MKIYKISANTEAEIKAHICELCEVEEWSQYLSNLDKGIHICVYLGKIIDTQATYDDEGNVITEATYFNGYHADIMADKEISFLEAITVHNPEHPVHCFA